MCVCMFLVLVIHEQTCFFFSSRCVCVNRMWHFDSAQSATECLGFVFFGFFYQGQICITCATELLKNQVFMGVIDMNKCIFFYTQDTLFEVIFLCKIKTGTKKKNHLFKCVLCTYGSHVHWTSIKNTQWLIRIEQTPSQLKCSFL